ncbi:MAG: serine hydrolase domain-containing protein, partial [Candidatus Thorarchaeota archaeon]
MVNQIDKIFTRWDNLHTPGCAVGVVYNNELIYSKGFGISNLEYGIPITTESVFRIASVSKQFTAACILLLEEQGKLSLTDYINIYFPEFPEAFEKIQIFHLLTHTSGIKDYLWLFNVAGYSFRALEIIDEEIFFDMIKNQKSLNFPPGEEFLYSNSGYVILALLIERVTGIKLSDFAKEHIFDPLNMKETHFHDDYRQVVKNRSKAYTIGRNDEFIIFETANELVGDGAIFTTITDMAKWAKNFTDNKLGNQSPDFVKKLTKPGKLNNNKIINYALGLRISNYKGIDRIYHAGMIAGFRSSFMRFPNENLTIFCFANLATINPDELCEKIADIFLLITPSERLSYEHSKTNNSLVESKDCLKSFLGFYRNKKVKLVYHFSEENNKIIGELFAVDPIVLYTKTSYEFKGNGVFNRISGILEPKLEFKTNPVTLQPYLTVYEVDGEFYQLDKIKIPEISSQNLEKYSGTFYSEELDTYYHIENQKDFLNVIVKRIEKIIFKYEYIGNNEFTCNQVCMKFLESSKGFNRFELSTVKISNPIIFTKIDSKYGI